MLNASIGVEIGADRAKTGSAVASYDIMARSSEVQGTGLIANHRSHIGASLSDDACAAAVMLLCTAGSGARRSVVRVP